MPVEAIKSFAKMTYAIRKVGVNVSGRLFHVNFLGKIIMKKGSFYIKLINRPIFRTGNAESIIKVYARLLREALSNKMAFVTIKFSLTVKLVPIKPLTPDNVSMRRTRNKIPSVIGMKRRHLTVHGRLPSGTTESLNNRSAND